MSGLRRAARAWTRHHALDAASAVTQLSGRAAEALERPRVHFPYFHAIPSSEEEAFRELLRFLARSHTFISYAEAVRRLVTGPIDKPYVALSFDDGFASNLMASRILDEYGAPGCFFVPTAFIDSEMDPREATQQFGFTPGINEPAMTWGDLEDMKARGHAVENHTMNHRTLSALSAEAVFEEIHESADVLRRRLGDCSHFAWPRGRFVHMTDRAARSVFDAGHVSCASATRGAHTAVHDGGHASLCIRRDHLMTSWPLRHNAFFLARSSSRAGTDSNEWPSGWVV